MMRGGERMKRRGKGMKRLGKGMPNGEANMDSLLSKIRIASPCHENWNDMTGDERSRHCAQCNKSVYNLSEMTEDEAIALLESRGQKETCVRIYRRLDGTVITSDCPVGVRKKRQRSIIRGVAATAVALAGAACSRSDVQTAVEPSLPTETQPIAIAQQVPTEVPVTEPAAVPIHIEEMGDFCIEEPPQPVVTENAGVVVEGLQPPPKSPPRIVMGRMKAPTNQIAPIPIPLEPKAK